MLIIARVLFYIIILAASPLLYAVDIDEFYGNYAGMVSFEQDGQTRERELQVKISGKGDGFSVRWVTISRKSGGKRDRKDYSIDFLPSGRAGIFRSAMKKDIFGSRIAMDPMKGEPYVWARLREKALTVYVILVTEDGSYDLQVYNRSLVGGDLKLEFQRFLEGIPVRNIETILKRQ